MKYLVLVFACAGINAFAVPRTSLLQNYQPVQKALSADDLAGAQLKAATLKSVAEIAAKEASPNDPQKANLEKIRAGSESLTKAANDKEIRLAFATVSQGVVELVRNDRSLQSDQQLYHCSMTKPYGGWVQPAGDKIANPYWGAKMLRCGTKERW